VCLDGEPAALEHPAAGRHDLARLLPRLQAAGEQLEQDLRLGLAAHRGHHAVQRTVGARDQQR
jgi:hypothetical protein